MELINFDECERPEPFLQKHYGGLSGNKEHIFINKEDYFLKYPKKMLTTGEKFKNVKLSYSNSPLSEYIGSHIYEILGFNVHKTILGYSKKRNHVLVACKDFLQKGDTLDEFKNIKVSYAPTLETEKDGSTSGEGCNLIEVMSIIKSNPFLNSIPGIEEHFWNMFVIDAFIGNVDRNNGNWGIIRHLNGNNEISPIYDNGNSFNNKWEEDRFFSALSSIDKLKEQAYKNRICIFTKTNSKKEEDYINPFKEISLMKWDGLNDAIKRIVPIIYSKKDDIVDFINSIPTEIDGIKIISDTQKQYHSKILRLRYNDVLCPILNKLQFPEKNIVINFKVSKKNKSNEIENEWLSK